tara:strand:+ start:114 stop:629 length:516 start_codon:yes stop_codon:yes gene_type:complete
MKLTVWQRLDLFSRQLTPFLLTVLLIFISSVPYEIPNLGRVMPLLSLIAIFHWGVYRAELLPNYAVFFIGFFQDVLSGVPIGIHTLIYILAYNLILTQQRFFARKSFYIIWLGFAVVSAGVMFLLWGFISILSGVVIDFVPVISQYGIGVGMYPIISYAFSRWQQLFLQQI